MVHKQYSHVFVFLVFMCAVKSCEPELAYPNGIRSLCPIYTTSTGVATTSTTSGWISELPAPTTTQSQTATSMVTLASTTSTTSTASTATSSPPYTTSSSTTTSTSSTTTTPPPPITTTTSATTSTTTTTTTTDTSAPTTSTTTTRLTSPRPTKSTRPTTAAGRKKRAFGDCPDYIVNSCAWRCQLTATTTSAPTQTSGCCSLPATTQPGMVMDIVKFIQSIGRHSGKIYNFF
ncbi:integumentary mucin C.1-like [Paramacrobiotus metropolitanus]|uniref:integumentary mucin C.1-like n=1 Tax=Paramacrobiotus metropolitanus TaxID=2943436 RepID=UPI002445E9F1|nr:integumentary mucin C.1-like [Paramacrobiotus metropolitanus]